MFKIYVGPIISVLLISLICSTLTTANTIDSLQYVATKNNNDSIRVKAAIELIVLHAKTVDEITNYKSLVQTILKKDHQKELQVINAMMARSCKLGFENYCNDYYENLIRIAKRYKNPRFEILGRITMTRYAFDKGQLEEANRHLDEIKELLDQNNYPRLKNVYFQELSLQARTAGNMEEALAYNDKAKQAVASINNPKELAATYSNRGRIFRYLGKTDSAEYYYVKAKEVCILLDLKADLPSVYNNLGNISHIKGNYEKAISYYMKSIALKEKAGDIRGLSIGYHNIGAIKNDMKAFDEAIIQFEKSNDLGNQIEFKVINVHNDLKIGWAYQMKKDYVAALRYHTKALELAQKIKFKKGETTALIGIGVDQMNLGNLELANSSLMGGLAQAEATGNKSEECSALVAIADWYTRLEGTNFNSATQMATYEIENLLLRAKRLSEEMDYGEKKLLVYDGLNKLYTQTRENNKKAVLLEEYMALKDSIFSEKRSQAITEWETKYTTAEKEKEIVKLEAVNKISNFRTKVWKWISFVGLMLFMIIGSLLYKYLQNRNQKKMLIEAERFRSKLSSDLHDDVGTMLSSLAMQSEVMGLTASPEQVDKFEKLSNLSREAMSRMRDTVWAIDSRKDKVESLIDRMKDYISDLMNGHSLKVEFKESISDSNQKISPEIRQNIYLIFKEAVNNAAKYSTGDQLKINYTQTTSLISLTVLDNGLSNKIKTSGTGISNMKMRAKRIGGTFNLNADNGFQILVKVPI